MTYREVLGVLRIKNLSKNEIKYLNQRLINIYQNTNKLLLALDDGIAGWELRHVMLEKKVLNIDLRPLKNRSTTKIIIPMVALVERLNLIKNREQQSTSVEISHEGPSEMKR